MKNKQEKPAIILADVEVFDYLKEKVGDRKTRTEAYCDLLDKSSANFVSPFLRKMPCELRPNQCHVTVSDLAESWHWHRATVRSFLETMESFGQLKRTKLTKSVVITMPIQSDHTERTGKVQCTSDFAIQLQEILSDWVIGRANDTETGTICGQLVRQVKDEMSRRNDCQCADSGDDALSGASDSPGSDIQETALCYIAQAALQKALRKSRFDDGSPLMDFFRLELAEEWTAFIETAKELAGIVLAPEKEVAGIAIDEYVELLKSLRKSFLSLAAKAQETDRQNQ